MYSVHFVLAETFSITKALNCGYLFKDLSRKSTVTGARNYLKTIEFPCKIYTNLLQIL